MKDTTGVVVHTWIRYFNPRMSSVQSQLAASYCDAEYYAYSAAAKKGEYVRLCFRNQGLVLVPARDAIAAAKGPSSQRSRTRRIQIVCYSSEPAVASMGERLSGFPGESF